MSTGLNYSKWQTHLVVSRAKEHVPTLLVSINSCRCYGLRFAKSQRGERCSLKKLLERALVDNIRVSHSSLSQLGRVLASTHAHNLFSIFRVHITRWHPFNSWRLLEAAKKKNAELEGQLAELKASKRKNAELDASKKKNAELAG